MRFAQISNLFFMQCDCGAMQLPHCVELENKFSRSRACALFNTFALRGAQRQSLFAHGRSPYDITKIKNRFYASISGFYFLISQCSLLTWRIRESNS